MRKLFNLSSLKLPLAVLTASLMLAGCLDDDDKKGTTTQQPNPNWEAGAEFHGAEWATIQNLDPRGEECVDCHGKEANLSPNGGAGHNIGLANNTDHSAYQDVRITSVKIIDDPAHKDAGKVTVTLNKPLPAGGLSMTFAKLAPRVIHDRGHDWQNYFVNNNLGRGGNERPSDWFENGGAAPYAITPTRVSATEYTFNLGDGAGRSFGKHDFTVKSAYKDDTETWSYENVLGTKFANADWGISNHVYCDVAHDNANQLAATSTTNADSKTKSVCWWPDGTHLTSGVFVSTDNEYIVEYDADLTHRVTFIVGMGAGNPGFNTWYDFVPSVANGTKTVVKSDTKTTNATELVLPADAPNYIANNGEVLLDNYKSSGARSLPPFGGNVDGLSSNVEKTAHHQSLPAAREVVDVQSCNSCHDGLTMHGGSGRSQTQVCVTCHNPGNLQASSGRSVDFKQLIHRIHRGTDLPSEQMADARSKDNAIANDARPNGTPAIDPDVTAIGKLMNGNKLVANTATDFTKVRFPQGPTPGSAAGITNCVKCHMGEETKGMVQGLADTLGAADFDVQSKMKLAKVTPQGDNWLSVRSVNACQACHDSNIWFADGLAGFGGNGSGSINIHRNSDATATVDPVTQGKLDKYMPFYSTDYSDTGYEWLGKKLTRTAEAGAIHNVAVAGDNGRFTCGSGGGCHGNTAIDLITTTSGNGNNQVGAVGNRSGNQIQQVHLELTRNYIIAERFGVEISEPVVDEKGLLTAEVQFLDKGQPVAVLAGNTVEGIDIGAGDEDVTLNVSSRLGWMLDSPDYNHSAGTGIPGNPVNATTAIEDGKIKVSVNIASARDGLEWEKIEKDLAKTVGSLFVGVRVDTSSGRYQIQSKVKDFRFDGQELAANEGRRKVVDFTAGNGIDEDRHRYAGWDKTNGANTQSCSSCHLQLPYHAGVSNNVEGCIMCHNPQRTDLNSRGRGADENNMLVLGNDEQYEESLDFKRIIHTIHSASSMRIDPMYVNNSGNTRPSVEGDTVRGHSFPGVIDNCKACHIETEPGSDKWTFELDQLPEGMIGSTAITGDWEKEAYSGTGSQHDFENHMKMSPIASVCSSCHDAGYKGGDDKARTNPNILDGGPYVGSHWWVMGGIAPGIVPNDGTKPSETKHQSGK